MKVYLISTALAVSLGINGLLISSGVQEASAEVYSKPVPVTYNLTANQNTSFNTLLDNRVCAILNTQYGTDVCDPSLFRRVVFIQLIDENDEPTGEWSINTVAPVKGTWTAGIP